MAIDDNSRTYARVFPATELPPYGEPVLPDEMEAGSVYFALQYLDPDLLVPCLYPLIFLGRDLDGANRNMRFFQEFDSYRAGIRYSGRAEDSAYFQAYGPDEGKHIFDYEHALRSLMRCALVRRETPAIDQRIRRSVEEPGESAGSL
jgi:hypothetical protein